MRTRISLIVLLVGVMVLAVAAPLHAQDFPLSELANCRGGAFSTEEDFMMQENEPYDGNPYISDGDVLSPSGDLCARNAELLRIFQVSDDLGLDALHIMLNLQGENEHVVAFSTELDDPNGNFTAGDLLFTNGGVIPNRVLMRPFGVAYDIGLDAVHLLGERAGLERLVIFVRERGRDLTPDELRDFLNQVRVDILFSVEGSDQNVENVPQLLDGDVLSFALGAIVAPNRDLLPYAPAGIPDNGVDFGLDALVYRGNQLIDEGAVERALFSTEILRQGEVSFTDGDVLNTGGVVINNGELIHRFTPNTRFLGLDALWLETSDDERPTSLDRMCGDRNVEDFDGGLAIPGGVTTYTGLYTANSWDSDPTNDAEFGDQPCGAHVPVDGHITPDVMRFRVAYRNAGTARPAYDTAAGVETTWRVTVPQWVFVPGDGFQLRCIYNPADPSTYMELSTDPNGWMNAAMYRAAENGSLTGCPLNLWLAVWNTTGDAPDPNGRYVLWLEWDDASGTNQEPIEHYVQLDNESPTFPDFEIRLDDGVTVVPPCGETTEEAVFQVWAQFDDPHYGFFEISLEGGDPPMAASSTHFYYDPDDGTPPIKNTDDTGTMPDGTIVHVRDLDMNALLGDSFVDCCYLVRMRVTDRSIRHSFDFREVDGAIANRTGWHFQTFAASP